MNVILERNLKNLQGLHYVWETSNEELLCQYANETNQASSKPMGSVTPAYGRLSEELAVEQESLLSNKNLIVKVFAKISGVTLTSGKAAEKAIVIRSVKKFSKKSLRELLKSRLLFYKLLEFYVNIATKGNYQFIYPKCETLFPGYWWRTDGNFVQLGDCCVVKIK